CWSGRIPVAATSGGQRAGHRVPVRFWQLLADVWSDATFGPHPLAGGRSAERRTGSADERKLLAAPVPLGSESGWFGAAPQWHGLHRCWSDAAQLSRRASLGAGFVGAGRGQ